MTEHPLELCLTRLWSPLFQALAPMSRVGVPPIWPPFKLLFHADRTQHTFMDHIGGYEHGSIQDRATGAVLGSHPLVLS